MIGLMRFDDPNQRILFLVTVLVAGYVIVYLALQIQKRLPVKSPPELESLKQLDARINLISIEDAQQQFQNLLKDKNRFTVEVSLGRHFEILARLPNHVRDLFRQFDVISTQGGEACVGADYLHDYGELIEIGGTEDAAALMKPGDEAIYEACEENFSDLTLASPTIYHWLLIADARINEFP